MRRLIPSTYHHQIQTRVEDMAVAPTPDDHEQEAEADTVGTITRVPYSVRPFSGTVYVGSGPSRQVFALGPIGRDVNTLHLQVKGLTQQMVDQANTEHSTLKRLSVMDKYLAEFDTDLRSEIKGQHALRRSLRHGPLVVTEALTQFRHYRERPYVAPTALVAPVARTDPDDPSTRPTLVLDTMIPMSWLEMLPLEMRPQLQKLVSDREVAALLDRATRGNTNGAGGPGGNTGGNVGGQGGAPPARECTYSSFMKCNPTSFHGNEGAVELCRWFEKTESVFSISECAERNKVATLGLEVANAKSWNDMKIMMREEFCPPEEIQRMEVELWNLRVKDSNISAYTQRFNELVLLCPEMVPSEKKKVEAYLRGLPENIKGETTSSRPVVLNEAVRMAHTLMEQKLQAKAERIAESNKRKWESNNNQGGNNNNQGGNNNNRRNYQNNNRHNQNNNQRHGNARALTTTQNAGANQTGVASKCNRCGLCHFDQCPPKCNNCGKMGHKEKDCRSKNVASGTNARSAVVCYECGERGHKSNACPKRADRQGGNVRGQAYVVRDAEHNQGPNVVTGTFLLNNRYVTILFDSGADKSFVDVRFSHLLDIKPAKLNTSYGARTNNGYVLGTFDVIIGMDWLVERDAVIVCGKKEVHVPYKNKTLVVKGDSGASRLKVISCIKARKYIERGSQLFLAQVTEKEPSKKQLQDVPVIRNFPEVFPDDLPGLPPPRQVEFRIELVPGAAPVARAPYRLAPSELKELSDQLKELLEKGFIRPSSSPWGAPRYGHYEFQVMPFGLTNALAVFMDLMIECIILSYSKKEHIVRQILEVAISGLVSVQFLGHVIKSKGFTWESYEGWAIRNWFCTTTPTDTEAMKEENVKAENLGRLIKTDIWRHVRWNPFPLRAEFGYRLPECQVVMSSSGINQICLFLAIKKTDTIEMNLPIYTLRNLYIFRNPARSDGNPNGYEKHTLTTQRTDAGIDTYHWSNSPTITVIMRASRLRHLKLYMGESVDRQFAGVKSRQKSYADVRRKPMEFQVGDMVMLKVSPWKGVIRSGKRSKLSPLYIGPFKIIERIGLVAYKLELPDKLRGIHNTSHVSNLKKCMAEENLVIPLEEIQLEDKLHFIEEPVETMDREVIKVDGLEWRMVVQIVLWIVDSGCSKHMTGDHESNLYIISIPDMADSSPVCLMSKASSTKSWLWHRRLSHLNFGTINDLTKLDLVYGLLKFKYGKDHLCSACVQGKSQKSSHPPQVVLSNHFKLELLHMDLCGPMRIASINGKKYILVIVDDYSRYTWVYFLRTKYETLETIKNFFSHV
ncbi:putative reverse transcriptase domain-containing protein [Tanacetum coccineum]|uniref:Reverse transcriptase domain-containing protein n=1 Tax=Tanacetum coccineum TaxID=301880 RepID=A0ABQ4Z4L0_9ASTR